RWMVGSWNIVRTSEFLVVDCDRHINRGSSGRIFQQRSVYRPCDSGSDRHYHRFHSVGSLAEGFSVVLACATRFALGWSNYISLPFTEPTSYCLEASGGVMCPFGCWFRGRSSIHESNKGTQL